MGPSTCERQHGWAKEGVILDCRLDKALTEPQRALKQAWSYWVEMAGISNDSLDMESPGKGRLLGQIPLRS